MTNREGRPYRVVTRLLARGMPWPEDPEVANDLEAGLRQSFFKRADPDFKQADWMRLEMTSAGGDGDFDTADDILFVSYIPAGLTLRLLSDRARLQRQIEAAYTIGRHHFRLEGNRYSLVDARRLAEFRVESLS